MDVLVISPGDATASARAVLDRVLVADPPLVSVGVPDPALVAALRRGEGDVAFGAPAAGLGPADRLASRLLRTLTGQELVAPTRLPVVLTGDVLPILVPFATSGALGLGIAVDAARGGYRLCEVPVPAVAPRGPLVEARVLRALALTSIARR